MTRSAEGDSMELFFFFLMKLSIQERITEKLWREREKTLELHLAAVISDFCALLEEA